METRILIVDDEPHVLKALTRTLYDEDYEVMTAESGDVALEMARRYTFKVVISDERMPGMHGSELLGMISVRQPEVVKMLLTGYASVESAITAVNDGDISRFLVKPWDDFELKMSIRMGIDKYDLEMKNRKLQALVRTQYYKLRGHMNLEIPNSELEQVVKDLNEEEISNLVKECDIDVQVGWVVKD